MPALHRCANPDCKNNDKIKENPWDNWTIMKLDNGMFFMSEYFCRDCISIALGGAFIVLKDFVIRPNRLNDAMTHGNGFADPADVKS